MKNNGAEAMIQKKYGAQGTKCKERKGRFGYKQWCYYEKKAHGRQGGK